MYILLKIDFGLLIPFDRTTIPHESYVNFYRNLKIVFFALSLEFLANVHQLFVSSFINSSPLHSLVLVLARSTLAGASQSVEISNVSIKPLEIFYLNYV